MLSDEELEVIVKRAAKCYEAAARICAAMRGQGIDPTIEAAARIGDGILSHVEHCQDNPTVWLDREEEVHDTEPPTEGWIPVVIEDEEE